jgi:hypothetical protein
VNAQETPSEPTPDLQLEIARLLLIDVVGYSKLLIDEQIELLHEINRIVRSTDCFRAAEASGHPSLASLNSVKLLDHPLLCARMERIVPRHAVAEPRRSTR